MAQFKTIDKTDLLKEESAASAKLAPVSQGTVFAGEKTGGFIKTRIPSISQDEGFVRAIHCFKIEIPEPLAKEDLGSFCGLVTYVSRVVGTDRDYLMAVAYDRTKNMDSAVLGDATSPKAGPFQFTAEAWQQALDGVAKDAGFSPEDRLDWLRQPLMAAILAKQATDTFEKTFKRLPKFKELYFLQEGGANALASLQNPDSVAGELAGLQKRLEDAYAAALEIIDKQPPWNRFMRASASDATWMAVAREEMARGVSETPDRRNTQEIADYFTAVGAGVGTVAGDNTFWCGAFVGYCVKNCGDAAIAATVTGASVGVGFWSQWGKRAPSPPPVGSIVILNGGGHVGFLAESVSGNKIKVLGGNQGGGGAGPDRVGIVEFNRPASPDDFRWLDNVPRVPGPKIESGDGLFVDLAPKIARKLTDDFPSLEKVHLAAILGNLGHECMGFRTMQEISPVSGGEGGLGWAQWTGSRRTKFVAKLGGRPSNDFDGNYDFLVEELKGSHRRAIDVLQPTTDLAAAVRAFESVFEVAHADQKHYESRERYALIAQSLI